MSEANRIQELEADKKRLDYLVENPDVYFCKAASGYELLTTDHDFMSDPVFATGGTLRAAIDAGMKATQ